MASFRETLQKAGVALARAPLEILQVNVGKLCNQACRHCHVEAGPRRTEIMDERTVRRLLVLVAAAPNVRTVDVTGGAPEMNPHFRHFAKALRALGKEVIDRCNLTVLFEPGQHDTARFLADNGVKIIASLPCYSEKNVDTQRGRGVFAKSIRALKLLNELGYAREGSALELDLVYNPLGPSLPPAQESLEAHYKERLREDFGIAFNRLFAITNMPIKRFLDQLRRAGQLEAYMTLLVNSFNRDTVPGVMCRTTLSVGWDGRLYDCDFNQMLELPVAGPARTIWDIDALSRFDAGNVAVAQHCYGCTAGRGSSCQGVVRA